MLKRKPNIQKSPQTKLQNIHPKIFLKKTSQKILKTYLKKTSQEILKTYLKKKQKKVTLFIKCHFFENIF